jgi:hypothetical protein
MLALQIFICLFCLLFLRNNYLLFVICYSIHYLLFIIYYLLFIIYYLLFIIYYLLFIIYYLLFIIYYLLFISKGVSLRIVVHNCCLECPQSL